MNVALLHLRDIQIQALDQALHDQEIAQELTHATQRIEDLTNFVKRISHRVESKVFELAIRELNQSFLAALNSHYRQSFSGQRLSLELWFAGIQFSMNELSLRKWKMEKQDIVWSTLINPCDGILSVEVARIYWSSAEKRVSNYRNIAEKIYRECSQFVHGNNETHHYLPQTFGYSRKVMQAWKSNLDTITLLFCFTFLMRFNEDLTNLDYEKLSQPITDILGHLSEARELLNKGSI